MEPKEIEFEKLESKYFSELSPDDCVVDAAAVMAKNYHYRCDYIKRKRIIFSIGVAVINLFPSAMVATIISRMLSIDLGGPFLVSYIILFALWMFLMEIGYRAKCKKPDKLQYFFISKTRLFVSNRFGDFIIPFEKLRKVKPIKPLKNQEKCVCIEISHGYSVLDEVKLPLYAGKDDGERLYNKLCEICNGAKNYGN